MFSKACLPKSFWSYSNTVFDTFKLRKPEKKKKTENQKKMWTYEERIKKKKKKKTAKKVTVTAKKSGVIKVLLLNVGLRNLIW
jgi:hypothetical protein